MLDVLFGIVVTCVMLLFALFAYVCSLVGGNTKMGSAQSHVPVTLDDLHDRMKYNASIRPTTKKHIGQRKLLLTEVQFLTPVSDDAVVVYAGSAPSNKGAFLASLFPKIRWVFVDPNPFDIKPGYGVTINDVTTADDQIAACLASTRTHTITIINDLMTIDLAKSFNKIFPNAYFISDIRTNMSGGEPTDADMIWNLAQQYNWIREMNPIQSMLKFRHPYYDSMDTFDAEIANGRADIEHAKTLGIDFVKHYHDRKLVYPPGVINLQAWAPGHSTETRLIIKQSDLKTQHDYGDGKEYEEKLFYLNTITRAKTRFHHGEHGNHIDECFDCALEVAIWQDYVAKHGGSVRSLIAQASKITTRWLDKYKHFG